ncbi:MAG TPA: signal peptidase I [Candidatus Pacearchaeota archaeon]|nr:signal peptidase I [Candidatus Pacearchaeota archaeon]HOK94267.1 signal peptidase I [Candidatus Pacearchaeota archaeon]HPO75381.1 signal peptidase I [Candidatus Pacearchaeota archaeon]
MNKFLKTFLEALQIFLFALAIVIPIRYFLFQPFFVSGASMEPNFESGEYLLIDEISYRFREPQRGEVIVFKYPKDPSTLFIKRIIGLPGETIEINDGKVIIYNLEFPEGKVLEEPYLKDTTTEGSVKVSLAKNEYFVLGDNRNHSSDSRSWGPVPRENIIGRAWISVFPLKGIEVLTTPSYSF